MLCREAQQQCEVEPRVALIIARAATFAADRLNPTTHYLGKGVFVLQGRAWKECANAFLALSEFSPAIDALDHADAALRNSPGAMFDLVVTKYVRASVLGDAERFEEAEVHAASCASFFTTVGDARRATHARLLLGVILRRSGRAAEAIAVWQSLLDGADAGGDADTSARLRQNLAAANADLEQYRPAETLATSALGYFERMGRATEALRARWLLARIESKTKGGDSALAKLRTVVKELDRLGMGQEATLARVDVVAVLIDVKRTRAARELCFEIEEQIENLRWERARRSVAYLRSALERDDSPTAVNATAAVRRFLSRLQYNPSAEFQN